MGESEELGWLWDKLSSGWFQVKVFKERGVCQVLTALRRGFKHRLGIQRGHRMVKNSLKDTLVRVELGFEPRLVRVQS